MFTCEVSISVDPTNPNQIFLNPRVRTTVEAVTVAKHVIFAIDVSSSMEGFKISAVKSAVSRMITQLNPQDKISVLSFNNTTTVHVSSVSLSDSAKMRSVDTAISNLQAYGGTSIESVLRKIATSDVPVDDAANTYVVLLTDGENGGPIDAQTEIRLISQRCSGSSVRILPIGIGPEYNLQLLEQLSNCSGNGNIVTHICGNLGTDEFDQTFAHNAVLMAQFTPLIHINARVILSSGQYSVTQECQFSVTKNLVGGGAVIPFDISSLGASERLHTMIEVISLNDLDTPLQHREHIDLNNVTRNLSVLRLIALERMAKIMRQEDNLSLLEKAARLQYEVLPLLGSNDGADPQEVIKTREEIISAIRLASKPTHRFNRSTAATVSRALTTGAITASTGQTSSIYTTPALAGYAAASTQMPSSAIEGDGIVDQTQAPCINYKLDFVTNTQQQLTITDELSPEGTANDRALLVNVKSLKILMLTGQALAIRAPKMVDLLSNIASIIAKATSGNQSTSARQPNAPSLDDYIDMKRGEPRHIAAIMAIVLGDVIRTNKISSTTVRYFNAISVEGLSHAFVVCTQRADSDTPNHLGRIQRLWVIDPTSPLRPVYDLMDQVSLLQAIQDYRNRGLRGILDHLLNIRDLFREQVQVPEELVSQIKYEDYDEFTQADLICPISQAIMYKPVRIKDVDPRCVFDEESIIQWLIKANTEPKHRGALPRELAAIPTPRKEDDIKPFLIPALDVRDQITLMVARKLNQRTTDQRLDDETQQVTIPTAQPSEITTYHEQRRTGTERMLTTPPERFWLSYVSANLNHLDLTDPKAIALSLQEQYRLDFRIAVRLKRSLDRLNNINLCMELLNELASIAERHADEIDINLALERGMSLHSEILKSGEIRYRITIFEPVNKRFQAVNISDPQDICDFEFNEDDHAVNQAFHEVDEIDVNSMRFDFFEDKECQKKIRFNGRSSLIGSTRFYLQFDNEVYEMKWLDRDKIGSIDNRVTCQLNDTGMERAQTLIKILDRVELTIEVPPLFNALIKEYVDAMDISFVKTIALRLIESGKYITATRMALLMCQRIKLFSNAADARADEIVEHSVSAEDIVELVQALYKKGLLNRAKQLIVAASRNLGVAIDILDLEMNQLSQDGFLQQSKLLFRQYATNILGINDMDALNTLEIEEGYATTTPQIAHTFFSRNNSDESVDQSDEVNQHSNSPGQM